MSKFDQWLYDRTRSTHQMISPRLTLRSLTVSDAQAMCDLRIRNRDAFRPFDPVYPESHFTVKVQAEIIRDFEESERRGNAYGFGIFVRSTGALVGRIAIRNIIRGAAQSGTLGFFLDAEYHNQGIMTEACAMTVTYGVDSLGLHRIDASVMPENIPSRRVFEKLGFREEGLAKEYLYINGAWRDHILYATTRRAWHERMAEQTQSTGDLASS
ncbi:MAG: GNAT family N-acetyltransferase [Acidimicrobiales bacterium]